MKGKRRPVSRHPAAGKTSNPQDTAPSQAQLPNRQRRANGDPPLPTLAAAGLADTCGVAGRTQPGQAIGFDGLQQYDGTLHYAQQPAASKKGGVHNTAHMDKSASPNKTSMQAWQTAYATNQIHAKFAAFSKATRRHIEKLVDWMADPHDSSWVNVKPSVQGILKSAGADLVSNPQLASAVSNARSYLGAALGYTRSEVIGGFDGMIFQKILRNGLDALGVSQPVGSASDLVANKRDSDKLAGGTDGKGKDAGTMRVINARCSFRVNGADGNSREISGPQSLQIQVKPGEIVLHRGYPKFAEVAKMTVPSGDYNERDAFIKLLRVWLNDKPPIPSSTIDVPGLGVRLTYVNDGFTEGVRQYFADPTGKKGWLERMTSKYGGKLVVVGGALCMAGFLFPPASAVGSAVAGLGGLAVAAGSYLQLPDVVFGAIASSEEWVRGYRRATLGDYFNVAGVIAASAGAVGSVGKVAKAITPKIVGLRPPTPAEANSVKALMGKIPTTVLYPINAVSDGYGMVLSSQGLSADLARLLRGDIKEEGELTKILWSVAGNAICFLSGADGVLTAAKKNPLQSGKKGDDGPSDDPANMPGRLRSAKRGRGGSKRPGSFKTNASYSRKDREDPAEKKRTDERKATAASTKGRHRAPLLALRQQFEGWQGYTSAGHVAYRDASGTRNHRRDAMNTALNTFAIHYEQTMKAFWGHVGRSTGLYAEFTLERADLKGQGADLTSQLAAWDKHVERYLAGQSAAAWKKAEEVGVERADVDGALARFHKELGAPLTTSQIHQKTTTKDGHGLCQIPTAAPPVNPTK